MWYNLSSKPKFIFFLVGPSRAINNNNPKHEFSHCFDTSSAHKYRTNSFEDSPVIQLSPELITYWKDS